MRLASLARLLLSSYVLACHPEVRAQPGLPACEWCGAADAPATLTAVARLTPADEPGERLILDGRILQADGRTPAANVLLYAYQTDTTGAYPMRGGETGNGRRHGALRGWLRTGTDGRYRIETIRPAPYPGRHTAAHIHVTLTPPGGSEGWLDDFVFSDDPLLSARERAGRGVVTLQRDANGVLHATRDLRLSDVQR